MVRLTPLSSPVRRQIAGSASGAQHMPSDGPHAALFSETATGVRADREEVIPPRHTSLTGWRPPMPCHAVLRT